MLFEFLSNSSFMVILIIIVLFIMSITVCYKSIVSYIEIYKLSKEEENFCNLFFGGNIALDLNNKVFSEYDNIYDLVVRNYKKNSKRDNKFVKEINDKKINYMCQKFEGNFKILATIASIAPYLGLLGTVIGIMNTFSAIAAEKSVSLVYVAPSIGESLIVTVAGLVVAIPANFIYNDLLNRSENTYSFYKTINEEIYIANLKESKNG